MKPGIQVTPSGVADSGDRDVLVVPVLEPRDLLDELHAATSTKHRRTATTLQWRGLRDRIDMNCPSVTPPEDSLPRHQPGSSTAAD